MSVSLNSLCVLITTRLQALHFFYFNENKFKKMLFEIPEINFPFDFQNKCLAVLRKQSMFIVPLWKNMFSKYNSWYLVLRLNIIPTLYCSWVWMEICIFLTTSSLDFEIISRKIGNCVGSIVVTLSQTWIILWKFVLWTWKVKIKNILNSTTLNISALLILLVFIGIWASL